MSPFSVIAWIVIPFAQAEFDGRGAPEASSAALAKSLGTEHAQTRRARALREEVRQKRAGDSR